MRREGTEILLGVGEFFYQGVGTWGVILTIQTFFKAKKKLSVNIEHQIKSKLAWPICTDSIEVKMKMVQELWLQLEMKFLLGSNRKIFI